MRHWRQHGKPLGNRVWWKAQSERWQREKEVTADIGKKKIYIYISSGREKDRWTERNCQRPSQPVRHLWRVGKVKKHVWTKSEKKRESICHRQLPQTQTDYTCLLSLWCVFERVYWLASTLWLLQRGVSVTHPITAEMDPAHFLFLRPTRRYQQCSPLANRSITLCQRAGTQKHACRLEQTNVTISFHNNECGDCFFFYSSTAKQFSTGWGSTGAVLNISFGFVYFVNSDLRASNRKISNTNCSF